MRPAFAPLVLCGSASLAGLAAAEPAGRTPRSHIQPVGEIAAIERATPWAGLVTTRAPAVLREQFRLERGAGLVVESVAPGSAAERAGLKRHDVIVSLDGQLLIMPEQFRLERGAGLVVESVAPGSAAERAGLKRHDVIVSLDGQLLIMPEQFVMLLQESGGDAPLECRLVRGGVEKAVSLRDQAGRPGAPARGPEPPDPAPAPAVRRPPTAMGTVMQLPDGSLQQRDADYVVKLTGDHERRLVIKDARGRIVFNGPIDTPEQRSRMPPDVRGRVESLERLLAQRGATEEATAAGPANPAPARIGALEIDPVEIR